MELIFVVLWVIGGVLVLAVVAVAALYLYMVFWDGKGPPPEPPSVEVIPPDERAKRLDDAERLIREQGVAFARAGLPEPYYLRGHRLSSPDEADDVFVEVEFNPQFVTMDGGLVDILCEQGSMQEAVVWLAVLLSELDTEPCPAELRERTIEKLFMIGSPDWRGFDVKDSWREFRDETSRG